MPDAAHFADRLIARVRELGHPLCAGLDPHLDLIPPLFARGSMQPRDPETAKAVEEFLLAALDRIAARVAIAKPQIAFFEQMGWRGLQVLERVVARARSAGLLVLLDAKRGDIGSTAEGYARAYLAADAPIEVDAITVNPYPGLDTLEPFAGRAQSEGRGLFVLVKTSNAGSGDFQDRNVEGAALSERVAQALAPLAERLMGPETGWSSLGVVVGATFPEQFERIREALPRALFLVPGYGRQGGSAGDALRGFVPGLTGLEGGVVSSSRALLFPDEGRTDDAAIWEKALDSAVTASIDALTTGVAGRQVRAPGC